MQRYMAHYFEIISQRDLRTFLFGRRWGRNDAAPGEWEVPA